MNTVTLVGRLDADPVSRLVGEQAVVRIRLTRSGEGMAREGSQWWIVRPRVGFGQITGLATVLSGPEIQVIPGKGGEAKEKLEFTGLENPPSTIETLGRLFQAAANVRYSYNVHSGTEHGYALPDRDIFHKASANRDWEHIFAMFRRQLG